ncbi:hypothetical protein GE21DRAFT_1286349 [Neurospora crassa]|nr:hypothetical protein GE21DRAFT_1286349 [Neurospora crassa]
MQDNLPHWFFPSRSLRCTFWPDRGMIQVPSQGYRDMEAHRPENTSLEDDSETNAISVGTSVAR